MIISPLHNDVLKKKEFWLSFSENHGFGFKHIQTPSRDVNKLKMVFSFKDTKVSFLETDAKPLICEFEICIDSKKTVEISQINMFDRWLSLFRKKHGTYTNSFFDKNTIKSNDSQLLSELSKDDDLLNLLNNSEFFSLYAYTDKKNLKVRITTTYFVNSYKKLDDIYSITCRIIGHFKQ